MNIVLFLNCDLTELEIRDSMIPNKIMICMMMYGYDVHVHDA